MTSSTVERVRFATQDPGEGEAYIRQMYVDSRLTVAAMPGRFGFVSDLLVLGGVFVGRSASSIAAQLAADQGHERMAFFDARRPLRLSRREGEAVVAPGGTACIPVEVPYRSSWEEMDVDVVTFASGVIDDVAAGQAQGGLGAGERVRFAFGAAVSPLAEQAWQRTNRLVRRAAASQVGHADVGLLVDDLTQLLAVTALTCFPNSTMADSPTGPDRALPASLRRAVAFIESHLDQPIRLTAIAEAARVSPRALNLTFNRHLGVSPIGYVRRARLDRVHHELKNARPGDGQTVTRVAARWGFSDLARFGVTYRRTYGRPPSQTLRHDPA